MSIHTIDTGCLLYCSMHMYVSDLCESMLSMYGACVQCVCVCVCVLLCVTVLIRVCVLGYFSSGAVQSVSFFSSVYCIADIVWVCGCVRLSLWSPKRPETLAPTH